MSSPLLLSPRSDLHSDRRWVLVQRLAASGAFRRSQRLQELLLFIAEKELLEPGKPLREQEIGSAVFGRPEGYDTGADTIVRVHIFQLRKRLKEYFETEGAGEDLIIEIPKGAYRLEFLERVIAVTRVEEAEAPVARPIAVAPVVVARQPGVAWRRYAGAAALLIAGVLLGWGLNAWRNRVPAGAAEEFWTQMFGNGRSTSVVVADSSATFFQDMLKRNISVQDYQRRQWTQLEESIEDPSRRSVAAQVISHQYTSFNDVLAAYNLGMAGWKNRLPVDVAFARDYSPRQLENSNTILDGTPRANPWMKLFAGGLNFQYDFDDQKPVGFFVNAHPRKGELDIYRVHWDKHGYSLVAYLPNLNHNGTVLILSGTDLNSAEAGARYVTSSDCISRLRERLGVKPGARLPYFEVLLEADLAVSVAPRFELVATRIHE